MLACEHEDMCECDHVLMALTERFKDAKTHTHIVQSSHTAHAHHVSLSLLGLDYIPNARRR
jgi:hypothetical protein